MNKSHAVASASETPTPRQMKEFWAQVASGRVTKMRLQQFLRNEKALEDAEIAPQFVNEKTARNILGKDIIFPDEIVKANGLFYTDASLDHLANTIPPENILRWCKANNYAVVAGPPWPMGLVHVFRLRPDLFLDKTEELYTADAPSFNDIAETRWLAIRKEPIPGSVGSNWSRQISLISQDEQVPNVGEVSWFTTTFYKVRGVRLFAQNNVRTSSVIISNGRYYCVGNFGEDGLWVSHFDCSEYPKVGIAASRRLPGRQEESQQLETVWKWEPTPKNSGLKAAIFGPNYRWPDGKKYNTDSLYAGWHPITPAL